MIPSTSALLLTAGALFVYMNAWYFFAVRKHDNSLADIAWGPGFLLVAITGALTSGLFALDQLLIVLLTAIWGGRLSWHIARRHTGEDPRYVAMRRGWKHPLLAAYVKVFVLQGVLLFVIALPILAVTSQPANNINLWTFLGLIIWTTGFVIEVVADKQLRAFIREGKGRLLTTGLWRYSRHPNYFGEAVLWWGVYIIALGAGHAWTILGPITITVLVRFISGVPLSEERLSKKRGWTQYARRTNAFIPWKPR